MKMNRRWGMRWWRWLRCRTVLRMRRSLPCLLRCSTCWTMSAWGSQMVSRSMPPSSLSDLIITCYFYSISIKQMLLEYKDLSLVPFSWGMVHYLFSLVMWYYYNLNGQVAVNLWSADFTSPAPVRLLLAGRTCWAAAEQGTARTSGSPHPVLQHVAGISGTGAEQLQTDHHPQAGVLSRLLRRRWGSVATPRSVYHSESGDLTGNVREYEQTVHWKEDLIRHWWCRTAIGCHRDKDTLVSAKILASHRHLWCWIGADQLHQKLLFWVSEWDTERLWLD